MLRKITLFSIIILLTSCGKDVVIVTDEEPPIENDEIFEVNLVGFTTDENRAYLQDVDISLDGKSFNSDESGFFHAEKNLIGRRGRVIQMQKDGYLPSFLRVTNHQSLETIMLNLQLVQAPEKIEIGVSGGNVPNENGELFVSSASISETSDFVFQSFVGNDANIGNQDQLHFGGETEFLLKEASIYVEGSSPLILGSEMEVQLNADNFDVVDVNRLAVFQYDISELRWKQRTMELSQSGNKISFSIDGFGWWTLAEKTEAQYGTLTLSQVNNVEVINAETTFTFGEGDFGGFTLYSSSAGTISTYFPSDKTITASLNDGQYTSESVMGFSVGTNMAFVKFDDEVQVSFEGRVYACDFTFSDGYVAIISEGQHKIKKIENGTFQGEAFAAINEVLLQFYSDEYELQSSKQSNIENLEGETNNFFSCADLNDNLLVSNGTNLLQDFDMCRVKVRPKETVVIGERSNDDVFLVSFGGTHEGVYDGLIYFPEITDNDVGVEVSVNIVLYDEAENKIGGFIKTAYISTGEELSISFIGSIE